MKIVIINGSPRSDGITARILHAIEAQLKNLDVEVAFFNLGDLNISQCHGCCSCYRNGSCFIKDDAEMLSGIIDGSDGLVLGSPTYASNVSGHMKKFIDRGHFVIEQLLKYKYCITVATGENYGNRDTSRILNNLVIYSGGNIVKRMVITAPFNGADSMEPFISKRSTYAAIKLYRAISERHRYILQSILHDFIFNIGIKPFVKSKKEAYKGVVEIWRNRK